MAGSENLKPLDKRPPEEAREIRSAGGKKSAEVRRRKKQFKEYAQTILNLRPRAGKKLMREWEALGYDVEAEGLPTLGERLAMQLARRAEEADDNALRLLMSYSHNPTMAEKLEADRIKAIAEGKGARVEMTVNREDAAVMQDIRALMDAAQTPADAGQITPAGEQTAPAGEQTAPAGEQIAPEREQGGE